MCNFEDGTRAATAASQANAELDGQYKRADEFGFFSSANEWHKKRTIAIYASAECVPTRSGRRGFPFKGERRLGKHVRKWGVNL